MRKVFLNAVQYAVQKRQFYHLNMHTMHMHKYYGYNKWQMAICLYQNVFNFQDRIRDADR